MSRYGQRLPKVLYDEAMVRPDTAELRIIVHRVRKLRLNTRLRMDGASTAPPVACPFGALALASPRPAKKSLTAALPALVLAAVAFSAFDGGRTSDLRASYL